MRPRLTNIKGKPCNKEDRRARGALSSAPNTHVHNTCVEPPAHTHTHLEHTKVHPLRTGHDCQVGQLLPQSAAAHVQVHLRFGECMGPCHNG